MAADGQIVIDVLLDDGDVARGVSNLDNQLSGVEGAGNKAAFGIGKIVAALGLVAIAAKGITMVKDGITSAFDRIDTMERFERVMTTVTGSVDDTKMALERTREVVTGTGYGLDVAAKAVQDFVVRGQSVDDATKRVEAWGDAVAFYGDGSNEQFANVADALAKMSTAGKVGMDQLDRLFDAGIDAVGMYAQATGRDAAKVQKDLSAGKITAEDFIDTVTTAMMEGTNGVTKIAGAAKDNGASWGATFDNMQAAVTRGVENIIKKIDELLVSNGLPSMRDMITKFGVEAEKVLTKVADTLPEVAENIQSIYDKLKPWIPLIVSVGAAVGGMVLAFATFNTVKSIIDNVKVSFMALNVIMSANPWLWIVGAVILAATMIYLYWEPIKEFFINLWEQIKVAGLAIWESLKLAWAAAGEWLVTTWNTIKENVLMVWAAITEGVMVIVQPFIANILNLWNGMKDGVAMVMEGFQLYLSGIWELIKNVVLGAVLLIVNLVTGDFEELKKNASAIMENIRNALSMIWEGIKKMFFGVLSTIKGYVKAQWENIRNNTSTIMENVKSTINRIWSNILSAMAKFLADIVIKVKNKFDELKRSAEDKMNNTKETIEGVWNKVMAFFEGIDLAQIGKDIIQGLINGIKSKVEAVGRAVKDVTDAITGKIKSILDIHSPSRVFEGFGVNIMEGLNIGLENHRGTVVNTMGSIGANAIGLKDKRSLAAADAVIAMLMRKKEGVQLA